MKLGGEYLNGFDKVSRIECGVRYGYRLVENQSLNPAFPTVAKRNKLRKKRKKR